MDAVQREAFDKAFSHQKKISLVVGAPKEGSTSNYVYCDNIEGVLRVTVPKVHFCTNVSDTGIDLAKACSVAGELSVSCQRNVAEYEGKRKGHLASIAKATGISAEIEVDWSVFASVADSRGYTNRVGECIDWYLTPLTESLDTLCADEMSKEALRDEWTQPFISFRLVNTSDMDKSSYVCVKFLSGIMVVCLTANNFASNVGETGNDIESRL